MIETIASILKLKGREIWSVGPDATVTKPGSSSSRRRLSAPPELAAGWSDISEYRQLFSVRFERLLDLLRRCLPKKPIDRIVNHGRSVPAHFDYRISSETRLERAPAEA